MYSGVKGDCDCRNTCSSPQAARSAPSPATGSAPPLPAASATSFPYGTFIINLTACVIIGFTLTYLGKRADLSPAWRFLIPVGFVGAYSTFSTYEWETLSTLRSGAFFLAALYAVGSLILGLIAVWGGAVLAEMLSLRTAVLRGASIPSNGLHSGCSTGPALSPGTEAAHAQPQEKPSKSPST